jgi:hypothetical protein
MDIEALFTVVMRALHILCVILLIGSAFHSWLSNTPIGRGLKGAILGACALIIVSGGYNLMTKTHTPPGYHIWFGIKILFVLHILAVHFMMAIQEMPDAKKIRMSKGIALSGVVVVILSAVLRWMSINQ